VEFVLHRCDWFTANHVGDSAIKGTVSGVYLTGGCSQISGFFWKKLEWKGVLSFSDCEDWKMGM